MRIHLITNLFAPDELAGAALYTDMATYLKERGHDVRVTTTFPYYPAWAVKPVDKGIKQRDEMHGDIPVRRIQMYIPRRVTGASRLLSDLSFLLSLLRRGIYNDWKPEVVITASPMLSQCIAQRFLYAGQAVPRLIIVQDFVVDAALELGILKMPLISKLLNGLQNWALRSAQTLSTISPQMLEKLEKKVGPDRRAVMISNWIHQSLQSEIDRQLAQAPPRAGNVLVYSGNFGIKQGLPHFIDQFRAASNSGLNWNLEVYGGGAEKSALASMVEANPSVKLGGVQDESDYVSTLLRASACLVTQRPGVGANFLPSKLLPALATGTPVLAVCDANSPLGREITESGCGEVIPPDNPDALLEVLQRWQCHPELIAEMSRRARQRAALYERGFVLAKYETELKKLTDRSVPSSRERGIATTMETRHHAKILPTESPFPDAICLRKDGSILLPSGMFPLLAEVKVTSRKRVPRFKEAFQLVGVLLIMIGLTTSPILHALIPQAFLALPLAQTNSADSTNSAAQTATNSAVETNSAAQTNSDAQTNSAAPTGAADQAVPADQSVQEGLAAPPETSDVTGQEALPGSAVQDISNQPTWLDNLWGGSSPLHLGLTVGETYDDNILISPQKTGDFVTHITPSIDFQKGDQTAPHQNYLNIYLAPTFYLYQNHSEDNRNDYVADLYYQYSWTRLSLGFEQNFQHLTDANLDIGSLVPRDIYTTKITASYVYNDHLTLFGTAAQQINSYPGITINEWDIDNYALYQIAPKLLLGAGPRFAFLDISGAPNETHQDFLARLKYTPGRKLSLGFDGGAEYLQYQDDTPSHLLPIFDFNITYLPRDGTDLYLTAGRANLNSFDLQGETIVNTSVQGGLTQRFLNDFYFTLSGGYTVADYKFGSGIGEDGEPRRDDDYYFAKAELEWDPQPWIKLDASFQRSENDSNFAQNTFNDDQINIESSVHF